MIQPQITGTFDVVSTIKGIKQPPNIKALAHTLNSVVAAYPADE